MLKLILGRAKSGKTSSVMEEIRARASEGRSAVLLVPEQFSHEAEREMLRVCGDSMSLRAEVLSFTALCVRAAAETGDARRRYLDGGGRLLCMALALDAVGSRLKVFSSARRQTNLQCSLLDAVDELASSRVSPDRLLACADGVDGSLGDKLRDMALISEAYSATVSRGDADPSDRLDRLALSIARTHYAGVGFFVDGFTDFTAQESSVLEALLACGADVTVCLTCDGLAESHEIFEPSRRAALRLLRAAEGLGVRSAVERTPEPPAQSAMDFLEKELFSFGDAHCDARGCVELCSAGSVTAECEAAAARSISLVRDSGCRWRDIAVAVRGYDAYRDALESVFRSYGVPLFSAKKSDLTEKPLPSLISSAFAVISGGWAYDDVLAYLRTGLAGLSAEECDELDNYVFLWSLHGAAWTKDEDWSLNPDGFGGDCTDEVAVRLGRINALRRRAAAPLAALASAGQAASTAAGQAKALARFFDVLRLPELLEARAALLGRSGLEAAAAEYSQLWDITVRALEQCASVLGDTQMDQETFGQLFCLMLTKYDVGTIPLSLDRVLAGDMDRMRRRHIKHLIVLGCDSSRVPSAGESTGIFSDDDREQLAALGIDTGACASDRLDREFSLVYNCLTLPEETLYMSYCTAGEEGAAAMPSFILTRAEKIFGLCVKPVDLDICRTNAVSPAFELAARAESARNSALSAAALRYFGENGEQERLSKLSEASRFTRGRLSRGAVRALYGDRLRLSASRIDKLSSCGFAYFLQYGLGAKPRQAAGFAPPEMGTFMHYILQNVAAGVSKAGGFAAVKPEQVDALCDEFVAKYVHDRLNDFREKSGRFVYLFRRLTVSVRSVVRDMAAELAKSDFRPLDFELDFGSGAFPPVELGSGDDALVLTGVADRIDGWLHDGKLYLRVVDYKTGRKKFSLSDVWYGMGMQMLLYLFALGRAGEARYGCEIVPAGVMYVPARDVLVSASAGLSDAEILAEKSKALRRSGLVLDDDSVLRAMEHGDTPKYIPVTLRNGVYSGDALASLERFGALSRHIDATLRSLASELRSGSIAADPYFRTQTENACALCDYAGACRFDPGEDKIRYISPLKPGEVWARLGEGGGGE